MVTIIQTPFAEPAKNHGEDCSQPKTGAEPQRSYKGYVEPDTKIPPKAKSVIAEISVNGVVIEEATLLAEAQQHPADTPGKALSQAARALNGYIPRVTAYLQVYKTRRQVCE